MGNTNTIQVGINDMLEGTDYARWKAIIEKSRGTPLNENEQLFRKDGMIIVAEPVK